MYVILNEVKNLIESAAHKTEILRLRIKMTLRHSLLQGERIKEGAAGKFMENTL